MHMRKKLLFGLVLPLLLAVVAIQAQAPPPSAIKRNVRVKADMPDMGPMEGYVVEVEIAPGGESGRHYHPGHEYGYPISGEATLEIDGKPPVILKPGTAGHIEPGVIHNAKNNSTTVPFKTLAIYIIEKGKPVAIPAPAK
jgi:quercetin dioxygenase-like cupin family protein